jgi:hypothetical protein
LTLWAHRLRVAKWCFYNRLAPACQFSTRVLFGFFGKKPAKFRLCFTLSQYKGLKIEALLI